MNERKNPKFLIVYALALFSTAALIVAMSYFYKMRTDFENELAAVRLELEEANRRYEDLIINLEEK